MRRGLVLATVAAVLAVVAGWGLFVVLPSWLTPAPVVTPGSTAEEPTTPERKIKVRLFFVSEDGYGLTGVEREVAYGGDAAAQARAILDAQIAPVEAPLVSAIPAGTAVRAVFVANGDAYVDLSPEVVAGHPGGSLNEQLTVYTLVSALKANLPAVNGVQILVNGKEVDSLVGHVDLRQPLVKSPAWAQ